MVKRLKYNIMLINDDDSEGHSTAVGQHKFSKPPSLNYNIIAILGNEIR